MEANFAKGHFVQNATFPVQNATFMLLLLLTKKGGVSPRTGVKKILQLSATSFICLRTNFSIKDENICQYHYPFNWYSKSARNIDLEMVSL